REVYSS
ncbi:thioesterase superfamily protein, partial [Vibrio parahaemolyticus EKP-028]